jgi:UDP-N-acetylglucosamine acyltransferase
MSKSLLLGQSLPLAPLSDSPSVSSPCAVSERSIPLTPQIHPTAVVHPGAEIHPTVQIGPHAVIGERVKIGADTVVCANVVIDGWTEIGARNKIFPGAVLGLEPQDLKYAGDDTLVKIGDDNRIRECVTINKATKAGEVTRIGNGNLLMAYVHVAHNCVLQDKIVIANAVSLAGHVEVESRAVIGGMAGFHQFVHVGELAMVGAMSRIDRDVPPFTLVEGSPSRVRTLNVLGLKRAGFQDLEDGTTYKALKKAYRLLFRSDKTLEEALVEMEPLLHVSAVRHLYHFVKLSSQTQGRRGLIPGK